MKKIIFNTTCLMILLSVPAGLLAQRRADRHRHLTDSLAILRAFMQVCNAYKQPATHLELQLINTTNFVTSPRDTAVEEGEFYLLPEFSYIRFGEVEQIVDDSVAVLVSDKLQKMIIYRNAGPIRARMKAIAGMQLSDSSIQSIAKLYESHASAPVNDTMSITLTSRSLLYHSSLPKNEIEIEFEPETKIPFKVSTVHRTLIPLAISDYESLKQQEEMAGKLLAVDSSEYFLIKEQAASFLYRSIDHEPDMKIPVVRADRIIKNRENEFVPAKGYEAYTLIVN